MGLWRTQVNENAAERVLQSKDLASVFDRAEKRQEKPWALQAAEKLVALKGHGFSRAANAPKSTRALAPILFS
jgi:hypothetical protein